MKKKDLSALLTLLAVVFFGCGAALLFSKSRREPISRSAFLLNTFVNITLYDSQDEAILDHCVDMCQEYENRFSKTIEGSELYKLNHRSADETTFTVSDDMAAMISEGLHYSEVSHGAYDLTIEPISSLWNFTSDEHVIPAEDDITAAAERVNWKNVKLDGNTLTFLSPDTTIDLGSIAKGYIADRMKDYLTESGVESAIINLGGNVLCVGERTNHQPFRIGLQKPFADYATVFADLNIDDMSVVSSGVYERHFEKNGVNYHHLLNPKTGYPYQNGLVSVTIVSPRSMDGDVLSTTCFSMGLDKGLELINSMDGIYAYFITDDYELIYSDGAEAFIDEIKEK